MSWSPDRRQFLAATAAAGSASLLGAAPPRNILGQKPVRVACVGTGNRGLTNCIVMVGQDVQALCDVDEKLLTPALDRFPAAKPYSDWREMLDKVDVEAVVISTPDHTHANIALAAIKKGLHVYVETPVAHTIDEVRKIEAAAKAKGVVAWMGNQHHVSAGYRRAIEVIEAGTIGPIKQIVAWTARPTWVQGVKRPTDGSPIPPNLQWDLWLGPAPERGYNFIYHPVQWRGWWDFGGGALTDMGVQLLDPIMTGLKLTAPIAVSASASEKGNMDAAPPWTVVKFEFAAQGDRPAVTLEWFDGGQMPPKELLTNVRVPKNGVLCIGELGKLLIPELGHTPTVIPNVRGESLVPPEDKITLTRGHQQDWLQACRDKKPNDEQFSFACRLAELCHVGNIAVRIKQPLKWDTATGKFDNEEANKLLTREYRKGWELPT